jgi:hypothetical protein
VKHADPRKRRIAPTWSQAGEHAIIPLENTDSWGDLLMPDTLPRDGGYPVRVALAPGRIVIGAEEGSSGGRRQDSAVKSLSLS